MDISLDMMTQFLNTTIGTTDPISLGHETGYIYDIMTGVFLKDRWGNLILNGGTHPRNTTVVAPSGKGKTTSEIMLACATVAPIPNAHAIFLDGETHTSPTRVKELTGWDDHMFKNKFTLKSGPVSMVDVYNIILQVSNFKKKNKKQLEYFSGYMDHDGTPLMILPPTIILLDSVANLISPGSIDIKHDKQGNVKEVENVVNNIDPMRDAKINTNMIKKIKGFLMDNNIHFRMINHLIETPPMGMFDIPKKHHPNLKPGQRLKGGDELIYQTAYMPEYFGTVEKLNDRNPAYGEDIRGEVMKFRFIKNKSQASNVVLRVVFDNATGMRAEATDFENLRDNNNYGFTGSGSMYLDAYPEVKFKRSNLIETCKNDPFFARALQFTARYLLMCKIHWNTTPLPMNKLKEGLTDTEWKSIVVKSTTSYPFYENLYGNVIDNANIHGSFIDTLGETINGRLPVADKDFWDDLYDYGVTEEYFRSTGTFHSKFDLEFDADGYVKLD